MQKNSGKCRGSQSRRPQPKLFHASGSARSRHATSGENPPAFSGNQASKSEYHESSPMTWATKWGRNPPPLPTCRRLHAPSYLRPFIRSPTTQQHLYRSTTHLTSNSLGDSLLLAFQNTRSCLNKSCPVLNWPPWIVYFDSVPPRRAKYATTSELL